MQCICNKRINYFSNTTGASYIHVHGKYSVTQICSLGNVGLRPREMVEEDGIYVHCSFPTLNTVCSPKN